MAPPSSAAEMAQVMHWMAFPQKEMLLGPQRAQPVMLVLRVGNVEEFRGYGRAILGQDPSSNRWLALDRTTIAEIAN